MNVHCTRTYINIYLCIFNSWRSEDIWYSTSDQVEQSFYVLVIGYVDGFESLDEVDVVLQLLHRNFETLLVGFL